jgi:hypothetical protein
MKKCLLLASLFSCLLCSEAFAGWYRVETYTGAIGAAPVHLSVQYYDSFGSGISVEGSYFFDSKVIPIPLYGVRVAGQLRLCEISGKEQFQKVLVVGSKTPVETGECPFALEVGDGTLRGQRRSAGKTDDVILQRVGMLDDTGRDGKIKGTIEIPFWGQTPEHAFIGTYGEIDSRICLIRVAVVDKKTRREASTLKLDDDDCAAGLLATPIYGNIADGSGPDTITVDYQRGRTGESRDYKLDPKTGVYRAQ